jgi:hypothetical protein
MEKLFDFKSGLTPKDEMEIELLNFLDKRIDIAKKALKEKLKEEDYSLVSNLNSEIKSYEFIKWFIEMKKYLKN